MASMSQKAGLPTGHHSSQQQPAAFIIEWDRYRPISQIRKRISSAPALAPPITEIGRTAPAVERLGFIARGRPVFRPRVEPVHGFERGMVRQLPKHPAGKLRMVGRDA